MQTPILLAHPWIHLDGILSHLINREIRGQDYWTLPSKAPLDPPVPVRRMPLKSTQDVFHASVSFFDVEDAFAVSVYKRFHEKECHKVKTRSLRVHLDRGLFKAYMMKFPYIPARTVTFYARGNLKEVCRLISFLPGLGKKVAYGFGQFSSISVEETPEDWSLVKDGKAMRPIPVRLVSYAEEQMMLAYKPPYWDKRLVAPCVPPGARVELK